MKPLRIHILPGNATYNRGDGVNLLAQIALLREKWKHIDISVSSFQPERDALRYDARFVRRSSLLLSREERMAIRSADIVLWGGGGVMADNACRMLVPHWAAILLLVRYVYRKPVMAWAHGVVLETRLGRILAPLAYHATKAISVRDAPSKRVLDTVLKHSKVVHRTADPALTLRPAHSPQAMSLLQRCFPTSNHRPFAIIAPTFWPLYHRHSDILPYQLAAKLGLRTHRNTHAVQMYIRTLAETADGLVRNHGMNVLLIPHYPASPWRDAEHLQAVHSLAAEKDHICVLRGDDVSPEVYASLWSYASLGLCQGYHDTILALTCGVPCLQLVYEEKGRALYRTLDAEDAMIDWRILLRAGGSIDVLRATARLVEKKLNQHTDRIAALEELSSLARTNITLLQDLLYQESHSAPHSVAVRDARRTKADAVDPAAM